MMSRMPDSTISRVGMRTVVSAGTLTRATGMSSKPVTERSAGTRSPRFCAAWRAPMAMTSVDATSAVGGSGRSMSRSRTSTPPWKSLLAS